MLAPVIESRLGHVGWQPLQIELIAVTVGPGSFTGLRVGVTTTKTLAYAAGAEVIGVNTLEVIAAQAPAEAKQICAVYRRPAATTLSASFRRDSEGGCTEDSATTIIDNERWLSDLDPAEMVTGSALRRLLDRLPESQSIAPQDSWTPRAETVARLALRDLSRRRRDDFWKLVPRYYRQSAAEEKLAAREK